MVLYTVFMIIEVFVGILLIIVVLMQASKGGGLAGSFGGSNIGAVFGVRRTSDFLTKATTVLATTFLILALFINLVVLPRGETVQQSVIQTEAPTPGALPPVTQPSSPQPQQP